MESILNDQPKLDHLDRITAQGHQLADPKAYIANAGVMLQQCRDALIKAESMHQAKRSAEMIAFKDRILRMDADHDKLCHDLVAMIDKLEALRS